MEHCYSPSASQQVLREFLAENQLAPSEGILPQIRIITQKKRDTLLKKGDRIQNVYIILQGEYTVSEAWSNGNIFIFTELGPADFICEMECYQNIYTVQYNLICKRDSTLLAIPVDAFLAWQSTDPKLCQMLIHSLIRKLGSSARTASQMPIASGIVKLIRFLINYYEQHRTVQQPEITIKMTREELSYNLGLSTRTINRLILSLKEKEAISVLSGKIHINTNQYNCLKNMLLNTSGGH